MPSGAVANWRGSSAVMVKVAKLNQDMRFDVPVIGVETIRIAAEARLRVIAVEAGKTLLLERDAIVDLANRSKISIVARQDLLAAMRTHSADNQP